MVRFVPTFTGIVAIFIDIHRYGTYSRAKICLKSERRRISNLLMEHHLAHIIVLLGPPPADFVKGGDTAVKYFNTDGECLNFIILTTHFGLSWPTGSWKGAVEIPKTDLKESEYNLEGEDEALFLTFVRQMLKWKPAERSKIRELLADTWLRDGDQFADER